MPLTCSQSATFSKNGSGVQSTHRMTKGDDDNTHYSKAIVERENRILHVVINASVDPNCIVTVFFDRRLRN